jgi:hypothetical protein
VPIKSGSADLLVGDMCESVGFDITGVLRLKRGAPLYLSFFMVNKNSDLSNRVPNDVWYDPFRDERDTFPPIYLCSFIKGALIGSLLTLAWDLRYPTAVDANLLKCTSVSSEVLPRVNLFVIIPLNQLETIKVFSNALAMIR